MKITKIIFPIFACLLLSACGGKYAGYEKTESGLYYQFFTCNETQQMPAQNDVVVAWITILTDQDSIIEDNKKMEIMMQTSKFAGDIFEALSMMHTGDSAAFLINAKQYYNIYNYGQIPDFVEEKTMLKFVINIENICTYQEFLDAKLLERQQEEQKLIADYLETNHIETEPTASGLILIKQKDGRGNMAKEGQKCVVHYTGKLLDGTVFDSSYKRNQPFEFVLGRGQVIQGWDEGFSMMNKGEKATLIIPSKLGYGENAAGMGGIPPFATLIFEVELLDIK